MAYPIDPEWRMNITTEDIVYPFADCTKTVYRKKTIELKSANGITTTVTAISEIKYQKNGSKTERTLTDAEFSVEQFEAMKSWSDAEYKTQVRSYVNNKRKCVARVEDLEDNPAIAIFEKFAGDEDEESEDAYRTVENALRILDAMKLTEAQKRRFLAARMEDLSTYEIGERENVDHKAVFKSIKQAEKKREKEISKFFLETHQKRVPKTPKN